MLEDNITTLKADMIAMKNFVMQEIFNITQRIKNIEQTNCRDEVKHLREENNSKNEIIKILSENISSIAFSTNTQVQCKEATQTSNSSNDMLFQVPKKFAKQHSSSNGNTKILTSPNRFENLRLQDDSNNMSFQNKRTDNFSFISNPVLVPHESVRMRNQNNKCHTFASHNSRRPSICTTEKYLQNYVSQQRVAPGIASYASATKSKNEKVCIIGDSHLRQINKRQFRKELVKKFSYFKCFSGANTKQLNYYVVPTLVDETPQTVVIHIGSNDISKAKYKTMNIQDLAQRIIDVGLKCKSYGVSRIAISSILTRSSAQLNQVIGKVNDLLKSYVLQIFFITYQMR